MKTPTIPIFLKTINKKVAPPYFIVGLSILIPGWFVIASLSFYCSISLSCNPDASNWWSLFITVVGIPIVVFQLYSLRKTIEESILKPKVEVGLLYRLPNDLSLSVPDSLRTEIVLTLSTMDSFLRKINKHPEFLPFAQADLPNFLFPIRLVVKNSGRKALRFVKIVLTLICYPGDSPPEFAMKNFTATQNSTSLIMNGGTDFIIYPKDFEEYRLIIVPNSSERYVMAYNQLFESNTADICKIYLPGKYMFECQLWAEGLDEAYKQRIILNVVDDRDADRKSLGIRSTESEKSLQKYNSSKFGFETKEDRNYKKAVEEEKAIALEQAKAMRVEEVEALAKKINPLIQEILNDFLISYEISNHVVSWDGKLGWNISLDSSNKDISYCSGYADKFGCRITLGKETDDEDNEVSLRLTYYSKLSFSPIQEIDEPQEKLFSTLGEVLSKHTKIPVYTHNRSGEI